MALSIQEAAAAFANSITANMNTAAANAMGVTVMWFRAVPDKRSQDVIFQSYTLFGVEDCPLTFNAMYGDAGYDDAAITYNIMGLEYSVPLTLDIPVATWFQITNNDGTTPQRGDIVFIPLSNKLVEVVSMTPVKAAGAQITSFKVNCSIYKPTRSRLVGENLKTSIEENTVNLKSRFGEDIIDTIENIVDTPQLGIFDSTNQDPIKDVGKFARTVDLISDREVRNIIANDLEVDGHLVARTYYNMDYDLHPVVRYKGVKDVFTSDDTRAYTCWVNVSDFMDKKNVRSIELLQQDGLSYLDISLSSGPKYKEGTKVVIERGNLVICGVVDTNGLIKIENSLFNSLKRRIPNWNKLLGYTIKKDNEINLLSGENENGKMRLNINANNYITIEFNDKTFLCQLPIKLKTNTWYGVVINIGKVVSADVFEADGELKKVASVENIKNKLEMYGEYTSYYIDPSPCKLTNIRYFRRELIDLDKQIVNLVSWNIPENGDAIINDSADLYLNKPYVGING